MAGDDWIRIGRPGALSVRKHEIERNHRALYGEHRFVWSAGDKALDLENALKLYDEAYLLHFKAHPEELEWITANHADVYDNNPSNVASGLDYSIQEFGGNHYQDIAIRRAAHALGYRFRGADLLEVRTVGAGARWGPGLIPFHHPDFIPQPALPGWWNASSAGKPGSIEDYWQSAKWLEAKDPRIDLSADIYFATGNAVKARGAQLALGDKYRVVQLPLDIDETHDDVNAIAMHKAKVAYGSLCRPVLADDSGFRIPSLGNWPDHHVKRELERPREGYADGVDYFIDLARQGHTEAYWIETIAYHDATQANPVLFESRVPGRLITERRGDAAAPHLKSPLGLIFVKDGCEKTVAEWTPQEHRAYQSDRWERLRAHLALR